MIDLVERAQGGDRDAYERLATAAAPRLYLVASRVLRDRDSAQDAVQQALVDIWLDLPSLRDPERFDAWSYRILIRRCRRESRRRVVSGVSMVDLSETLAGPGDLTSDLALHDELERAFQRLKPDHRAIVVLHHVVGLSLGEIADILEIPYGTVGSRLHHAVRAMRTAINAADQLQEREGQLA